MGKQCTVCRVVIVMMGILLTKVAAQGGPPLPTHQVEGNSGVFITPTAYFANPAEEGQAFGLPSISGTYAYIGQKDFEAFVITENLWGRIELGYGLERIGLGDWPDDVKAAMDMSVQDDAYLHNFNARLLAVKEGSWGCSWMPAVSVGAHYKWNQDHEDIDDQLDGTCDALGSDHDSGIEFTLTATKTIAKLLPRPLIVSAGLRNGDAIHTGLLGFAGERRTTVEGSVICLLTDKVLIAGEYRQKSDLCKHAGDLVRGEDDWWDICLGYIVDDHITVAGGYANFGDILNHKEDNVWAIQVKYEF
ncbi:MAG TPA: DUF3034 family protein [Sedimentisphaerales bacterium]|jgi:hypothetical protein|nr:DUF3034 family protein [Sedimentisphaerales bacterium]HNU30910.1 DUF3034 family protein [Sedimentisphaerales bacterium]